MVVGVLLHDGMNRVREQPACWDVAGVMHAADEAVVAVLIGTGEDRIALFGHHFSKCQPEEIAGRCVARGIGVVLRLGLANRFQRLVEIVGPDAGEACFGGCRIQALIVSNALAECGKPGERYILGGEDMTLREILGLIAALVGRKPPASGIRDSALVLYGNDRPNVCRLLYRGPRWRAQAHL